MIETEISPKAKKICMVSQTAFSLLALINPKMELAAKGIDLFLELTPEKKSDINNRLNQAIDNTFKILIEQVFPPMRDILTELCTEQHTYTPNNLGELIKETEEYRNSYYTNKDVKNVVDMFEYYFRQEVAQDTVLSHWLIVSETMNIDNKMDILIKDINKYNYGINDKVVSLYNFSKRINIIMHKIFTSLIFVIISMFILLLVGVWTNMYNSVTIIAASIAYAVSEVIMEFISPGVLILKKKLNERQVLKCFSWETWWLTITQKGILPIIITAVWFVLLSLPLEEISKQWILTFATVIVSNIFSIIIKENIFKRI